MTVTYIRPSYTLGIDLHKRQRKRPPRSSRTSSLATFQVLSVADHHREFYSEAVLQSYLYLGVPVELQPYQALAWFLIRAKLYRAYVSGAPPG